MFRYYWDNKMHQLINSKRNIHCKSKELTVLYSTNPTVFSILLTGCFSPATVNHGKAEYLGPCLAQLELKA